MQQLWFQIFLGMFLAMIAIRIVEAIQEEFEWKDFQKELKAQKREME